MIRVVEEMQVIVIEWYSLLSAESLESQVQYFKGEKASDPKEADWSKQDTKSPLNTVPPKTRS